MKVDNELYVRDYSKCILCYKCVDACGEQYQNTFAIAVAGRGFDARISTEFVAPLPESACVYCGNCIAVCPTGALMFKCEYDLRAEGAWDESTADGDRDDLPVLRRRLQPQRCTSRTTRSSRSPPLTTTTSPAAISASRAGSGSSTSRLATASRYPRLWLPPSARSTPEGRPAPITIVEHGPRHAAP